jgi:hypothetical protein
MDVVVQANGALCEAQVLYASENDVTFLDEWRASIRGEKHPLRLDAYTFAKLALKRREVHRHVENYADRESDIADFVRDNPRAEVANLVVLKSECFPPSRILGVCHFRRTWNNNVVLDYLSVHPHIARCEPDRIIKGAGTALIFYVATAAVQLQSNAIWGEATQNSCEFYQRAFGLAETADLIYVPRDSFEEFAQRLNGEYTEKIARLQK